MKKIFFEHKIGAFYNDKNGYGSAVSQKHGSSLGLGFFFRFACDSLTDMFIVITEKYKSNDYLHVTDCHNR